MPILSKVKDILSLPLVKNTMKLSSSSIVLMIFPLVVTPILSRLYTPEDYGDWGLFASFLSIILSFIFLSYESTIIKSNNNDEVSNILCLCLILLIIGIILVGCVFFIGNYLGIQLFTNFPCLSLLFLLLFMNGINTICVNLANREKIYGKIAISNVINGLSQAIFRILLGLFPIVAYGLIVGNVVAQIIPLIFLLYYLKILYDRKFWYNVNLKSVLLVARRYKKFPLYDAPARLIEFSLPNLALIILTIFCSKEKVGCYSMVAQFVLMPLMMVGSAMANVYYREISECGIDRNIIALSTKRVAKIAFSLSFLPLLFLTFGGDKLLVFLLGEQWEIAGKMALCMVIYSIPVILSEPLLPIFRAFEAQDKRFRLNCLCIIISLGGLAISLYSNNNIYLSLIVYSALLAIVRYMIFFKELDIAKISLNQINPRFILINILCYGLLISRIVWELY